MNANPELDAAMRAAIRDHAEVLAATEAQCLPAVLALAEKTVACLRSGGKIVFFGNGGSASDAQHMAAELSIRFVRNRRALAGLALTTDTSAITACGNDFGFDQIFSRQLEALGRPGDLAIAFSTSGNSRNVLRGVEQAKAMGIYTAAFTGRTGGALRGKSDLLIAVPSDVTARVQEMHGLLGHLLCEAIEDRLG